MAHVDLPWQPTPSISVKPNLKHWPSINADTDADADADADAEARCDQGFKKIIRALR